MLLFFSLTPTLYSPSLPLSLSLSSFIHLAAPQSVLPPSRVASVNGSSAEVSWEEPPEVRGVIEHYVVKAYSRDSPLSPPISATFNAQWLMGKSHTGLFAAQPVFLNNCSLQPGSRKSLLHSTFIHYYSFFFFKLGTGSAKLCFVCVVQPVLSVLSMFTCSILWNEKLTEPL